MRFVVPISASTYLSFLAIALIFALMVIIELVKIAFVLLLVGLFLFLLLRFPKSTISGLILIISIYFWKISLIIITISIIIFCLTTISKKLYESINTKDYSNIFKILILISLFVLGTYLLFYKDILYFVGGIIIYFSLSNLIKNFEHGKNVSIFICMFLSCFTIILISTIEVHSKKLKEIEDNLISERMYYENYKENERASTEEKNKYEPEVTENYNAGRMCLEAEKKYGIDFVTCMKVSKVTRLSW